MKAYTFICLVAMFLLTLPLFGNGVLVVDAEDGDCFTLLSSQIAVDVEDQVAVVTTVQEFVNQTNWSYVPKYAFPLPEGASATQLRWLYNGDWYTANFAAVPQDSLPPGPGQTWSNNLVQYLGSNPLYYNFEDVVAANQHITVQLTYVMLLPYSEGNVTFNYTSNYLTVQDTPLDNVEFNFQLSSQRTIMGISLVGMTPAVLTNDGHAAVVTYSQSNTYTSTFNIVYSLDPEQFGLFSMSTKLDTVPDDHPNGFFLFIAEPDPDDNQVVINKTFSLIIDRSGSMSGDKMTQAKNAANYIVDHLNTNDYFNLIAFQSSASQIFQSHVPATVANRTTAHAYINSITAGGGTDIGAAFDLAVPQFNNASETNANIIIFLTDGEATAGITDTPSLRAHINQLFTNAEIPINLFNFGIGVGISQQLLTQIALDHNGFARFLGNNELETEITQFFNLISYPVLLHPTINFTGSNQFTEIYPNPLPNIYQGSQLLVLGRYASGGQAGITLNGQAYNANIDYNYNMDLATSLDVNRQFLTKIWAKMKIEYLLSMYYSSPANSADALEYRRQIIDISLAYGVISPFTSFSGGDVGTDNEELVPLVTSAYQLGGNYPNPFNPSTTIRFSVLKNVSKLVKVNIYNLRGQVVRTLALNITGKGDYEVYWDGTDMHGKVQPSGVYFYVIDFGDAKLSARMIMIK